jgi:hypothetical protein
MPQCTPNQHNNKEEKKRNLFKKKKYSKPGTTDNISHSSFL